MKNRTKKTGVIGLERIRFGNRMVMPAFILMAILLILPLAQGIGYAFTNYRLDRPRRLDFVFLDNFIKVVTTDKTFYSSLAFTLINAALTVTVSYLIGFAIALLLNQDIPGRGVFRALILLPWIISSSVTATNWQWLLNDRYGVINLFLQKIHLVNKPIQFLANPAWARVTVITVGAWKMLPFMTIVILAGLQSVPSDLYEAASIDGAGFWDRLRYVTVPGISGITTMVTTLQFIWQFNNFEMIWLLTHGGPNEKTYTLPIYIYQRAFGRNNIAYASSIAVIILVFMIIFTVLRFRLQRNTED